MAQKYVVQVIDDLDGTELAPDDVDQVHFGLDGTAYVIDLSTTNAATLRTTLARYADAARREQTTTRPTSAPTAKTSRTRTDLPQVREWANSNGYTVSDRGRIPNTVLTAYDASH